MVRISVGVMASVFPMLSQFKFNLLYSTSYKLKYVNKTGQQFSPVLCFFLCDSSRAFLMLLKLTISLPLILDLIFVS